MESSLCCWLRRQSHSLHRPLAPAVIDVVPPISASLYFSFSHDRYKLKTTTNSSSKWKQQQQFLSSFSPLSCSKYSRRYHADPDTGGFRTTAQSLSQSQPRSSLSEDEDNDDGGGGGGGEKEEQGQPPRNRMLDGGGIGGNSGIVISSVVVGLLTGVAVVLFNNSVHEIRDLFWDGIPYRGAAWLREGPLDSIWIRVVSVPTCGGIIVALLNSVRFALDDDDDGNENAASSGKDNDQKKKKKKAALLLGPLLKAVAACFTLGTGNSLGPEGPSVEIGASIAKGLAASFNPSRNHSNSNSQTTLSLLAAGSAAGISSGFNAAVAGCFFAVESVLWPSPSDSSVSLTNTTSMVILSSVIASVVSEVGLGSEPAFKVPDYDFRSPGELPLYLLLGLLCGLVSLTLSRCTSFMLLLVNNLQKAVGIPKAVYPVLGSLAIGTIALAYPEILYWGFENVDILLESRPFVKGLSANLLIQLVGVKVVATALSRASGLVGGYYAPSLFIGAATGMAYGKVITFALSQYNPALQFPILEVATPQAYGLVGMAATLAGVCQVPLTAVLLLFELTQDYRIVIPLLGAVGLSSWVTSGQMRRRDVKMIRKGDEGNGVQTQQPKASSGFQLAENEPYAIDVCEIESSLCVDESSVESVAIKKRVLVSEAMRTRYVTVLMSTLLTEAVSLMLVEKQSCAMIIDDNNILIGLLTLRDIEDFCKAAQAESMVAGELLVSQMCSLDGDRCRVPWTAIPTMDLLSVQIIMDRQGVAQVPVVSDHVQGNSGQLVGLLDRECVSLTFRALATREFLGYIPLRRGASPDNDKESRLNLALYNETGVCMTSGLLLSS